MCDKKTCESCASYYVVRPTMGQGSCLLDELDKHGCAPIHDGCEEACMHWVPKPPTSEERCRQLEQLAREMWHYVVAHNTRDVPGVDMSGFEDKLEALGVRLYG